MGDQEDRAPVQPPQLGDERLHLAPGQRVQRAERLVQQQEFGLPHQRTGQRDALRLPAGQRLGPYGRPLRDADLVQRLHRERPVRPPGQPEHDVAPHLQPGQQPRRLEGRAAPRGHRHLAADLVVEPGEDPQQRRLAAAAVPEQRHELALTDVEIEIVQHGVAVEGPRKPPYLHGVGHGYASPSKLARQVSSRRDRIRTAKSQASPSSAYTTRHSTMTSVRKYCWALLIR